jgi:hypothetical protein
MRIAPIAAAFLFLACAEGDSPDAAPDATEQTSSALPAEIEAARTANDKYSDVTIALAEGYIEDPSGMCVAAADVGAPPELGQMGIHYVNLVYLGAALPAGDGPPPPGFRLDGSDAVVDPARPEILVYEPNADGGRTLVALEYMVFEQAWAAAGNAGPPTLAGEPFTLMTDDPATPTDEAHGFEPHYELHVWTHRENPTGLFAEFNPNVSCPTADEHTVH